MAFGMHQLSACGLRGADNAGGNTELIAQAEAPGKELMVDG